MAELEWEVTENKVLLAALVPSEKHKVIDAPGFKAVHLFFTINID